MWIVVPIQHGSGLGLFLAKYFVKSSTAVQEISEQTGNNINPDIDTSIETVLNNPNKVHFSDLAYFKVKIFPPGGNDLRGKFI